MFSTNQSSFWAGLTAGMVYQFMCCNTWAAEATYPWRVHTPVLSQRVVGILWVCRGPSVRCVLYVGFWFSVPPISPQELHTKVLRCIKLVSSHGKVAAEMRGAPVKNQYGIVYSRSNIDNTFRMSQKTSRADHSTASSLYFLVSAKSVSWSSRNLSMAFRKSYVRPDVDLMPKTHFSQ